MKHISLEGIDGSGKTTQLPILIENLTKDGIETISYHYTSKSNNWGRIIAYLDTTKDAFLSNVYKNHYFREFLYSMSAKKNYKYVQRSLNKDSLLVSDRSLITAYASHINTVPIWFLDLCEHAPVPDIALYLDISPEKAFERINNRIPKFDESLESLCDFKDSYEKIILSRPEKLKNTTFIRIDADRSEHEVSDQIYESIKNYISLGGEHYG